MSRHLLLLSSAARVVMGQDTGGPYTGTVSVNSDNSGSCIDNRGQMIQEGRLFEPGPDECQVCTCLRQLPVLCRTVLCAPPQGCRGLRVGDACCEWVCDQWDTEMTGTVSDLGLRLMASAITAIFALSLLFFLIYRLRQRKLRGRQNHLEAEGYSQDEIIDEVPGHSFHLDSRKPHDRVMMRRPFPPTYSEAMCGLRPTENMDVSTEQDAPPYTSIHQDPVISYPVTSLGRLVLPPPEFEERPTFATRRALRRAEQREHCRSSAEESNLSRTQLPGVPEPLEDVRWGPQHPSASPSIINSASLASPPHDSCQNRISEPDLNLQLTQTRV